jgi:hypothetical protein
MNRRYLVLGAAVVLAAVIGLVVVLRRGDGASTKRDEALAKPGPVDPKTSDTELGRPGIKVTQTPSSGHPRPAELAGSGSAVSEYMIGGVHVRDHRSGDHAPLDLPPAIHPPEGRKISSRLTSDIAQKLRAVTTECAASVPSEARGATPRLDGEILIAIKNQQATVTSAVFQVRDVAGGSTGPVKECMEQKTVGVATPSGDEPDVQGYAITLSLRLP